MRRHAYLVGLMVCAGCGARTGPEGGDAVLVPEDAAVPDAPPGPRSCWSEPNCIEADVSWSGAVVAYRSSGLLEPTSRVLWLTGDAVGPISITVKLFRDAAPGVQHYDPEDGNVFVFVQADDSGCVLVDDILLMRVETRAGGVTEGAFTGELHDCRAASVIDGRFRLTAE